MTETEIIAEARSQALIDTQLKILEFREEVVRMISDVRIYEEEILLTEPGTWQWTPPSNATSFRVDIGGGGASGEGLYDLIPSGVDGQSSCIYKLLGGNKEVVIEAEGGVTGTNPADIDYSKPEDVRYKGGAGEDSLSGKGGKEYNSEDAFSPAGTSAGGNGVTHGRESTSGGGAGDVLMNRLIDIETGLYEIVVGAGSAGEMPTDPSVDYILPGKGGDGFVTIRYQYLYSDDIEFTPANLEQIE